MQSNEAGGYWLDAKNPEYDQIQYYLKTCLLDRGVSQNLEVWKIENPESNYKYERKTSNMLKVACWSHSNTIEGCSLEDICTKGVRFDRTEAGGMEFKTGVIDFSSDLALYTSYCLVYFEVAVGRAYVSDKDVKLMKIPAGYDSLYIPPVPLDRNNDGEFDLSEYQSAAQFDNRDPSQYRHRYFVKDPTQVCPKYVVRFDLAKKIPGGAIGFSPTGAPRSVEASANTEDDDLSMFDPITLTAVSKKAQQQSTLGASGASTILGLSSSSGPNSAIPIHQAFNQAMEDFYLKDKDPVMLSKRDWTSRQLSILEEKVREVTLNYAEISEAIAEAAAKATLKLQNITRSKLETCLSMEIELRREAEQLAWLDAHVDAQMRDAQAAAVNTSLPKSEQQRRKLDFIKSWKYYTIFRNSVSRSKPTELQALSGLHGDTKIHSDIQIFADPFYSGAGNALSTQQSSFKGSAATESHFPMQPYAVPAQPTELLVSASLQSLVDVEMEAIQRAVRAAVEGEGPPLPRTVERPLVGGDHVNIALHELLDGIAEEPLHWGNDYGGYDPLMMGGAVEGARHGHLPPLPEDGEYRDGHELAESKEGAFARALAVAGGAGHAGTCMTSLVTTTMLYAYANYFSLLSFIGAEHYPSPPAHPDGPGQYFPEDGDLVEGHESHHFAPAPLTAAELQAHQRASLAALFPSTVSVDGSVQSHGLPPQPAGSSAAALRRKGSLPPPGTGPPTAAPTSNKDVGPPPGRGDDAASVLSQNTRATLDAPPPNMNTKHQGKVIYMDRQQLQQFASSKYQHSLKEISARKRKQMQGKSALSPNVSEFSGLHNSEILTPQEADELFFSLPFFTKPPSLRLIYSTTQHYRSLEELLSKTFKVRY